MARLDVGRLAFIPFAVLLIVGNLLKLRTSRAGPHHCQRGYTALSATADPVLLGRFVGVQLMRQAAVATTASRPARLVVIAATCRPLPLPLLGTWATDLALATASNVLVVVGLGWSLWSLRTLGTSFGIASRARKVVTAGRYRWVRHPV